MIIRLNKKSYDSSLCEIYPHPTPRDLKFHELYTCLYKQISS